MDSLKIVKVEVYRLVTRAILLSTVHSSLTYYVLAVGIDSSQENCGPQCTYHTICYFNNRLSALTYDLTAPDPSDSNLGNSATKTKAD